MKEYRRVLNREYILIKGTVDKYGMFRNVKIVSEKKRYHHMMCNHCKNYLYLSGLQCNNCNRILCERHLSKCTCLDKSYTLHLRELNQDRQLLKTVLPVLG